MKRLHALFTFLLFSFAILGQNPSRVNIKGVVFDTAGTDLPFATIMLLNPKDSALINFTRGDDKGAFEFKNVKNTEYLLKISYVGYIPYQQNVTPSVEASLDLGKLYMKPITKELLEVVVKTAKAPLSIKGDTIEYNASSFKVPPGSTVEDLLRRLPGIEVDADGNIKAQGKDVRKVYVDGKTFFGSDPKAATKNLGAETISKVQVFNEKSEQAKLTGVDDGKKEKAMNLELKEEFKKGSFGKITGAIGDQERWAARGNYNRFNKKEQFSIIGYGNNINQTGINWEDYGEFKGQNSFNDNDNGDFGFNSNSGFRFFSMNAPFMNNFDGRGFTNNAGSGVNYNFDNKKFKFNSSYFYNQTRLTLDQFGIREAFLSNNSFENTDTTTLLDFRGNHTLSTRLEHEIDSNNTFIAKVDGRFNKNDVNNLQKQAFSNANNVLTNTLKLDNKTNNNTHNIVSSAIFRHRFKKKGQSFAASVGYNDNSTNGVENVFNVNTFFQATTFTEQVRQLNTNDNTTKQLKSSALYTMPFSKKIFFESFYNFSTTQNDVLRKVQDPERNNERIDNLSVFYDNDMMYNRLGTSLRYAHNGVNIGAGLGRQRINLNGKQRIDVGMPLVSPELSRKFDNWVQFLSTSVEFKNNIYLSVNYNYSVNAPQINDLQPVLNINNPAFRIEGNPNLTPELAHSISGNFNYFNPASFANIGIWGSYEIFDSRIVYSQIIENIDRVGIRTTTRPENTEGGYFTSIGSWLNFPIIKTKLTMNGDVNVDINQTPAFVNNVKNETLSKSYNVNMGADFTPNQKLILTVRGRLGLTYIDYSIQKEQNQKIINNSLNTTVKWNFASKFFFESNFDYSVFRNDRFDFNQSIPIWNASIRHLLTKDNKIEMRLAGFDILNRRVAISQTGDQNFVQKTVTNTLARYFMLSVTYNVRGHENKLKKNNWF